jgi:glycosyltransferase involved in cell wall biosynthesis
VDDLMDVSILICTYGDPAWEELAYSRAYPSTLAQGAQEVLIEHEPDLYLDEVRQGAAEAATGDWLCFLDADDELAPGYLAAMRKAMHHWNLWRPGDLLANPLLLVPAVQYVHPEREEPPRVLNDGRPLHEINRAVIGTLIPRRLFVTVGGFPAEPVYEDWGCWLACERAGARLVDVPAAVYRAHVRTGSRNVSSSQAGEVYSRLRRQHEAWLREKLPA